MKIMKINAETQSAFAELSEYCSANLLFNADSRKCWTCPGFMVINKDAIVKVDIE
jgi:hypothetical protein